MNKTQAISLRKAVDRLIAAEKAEAFKGTSQDPDEVEEITKEADAARKNVSKLITLYTVHGIR